MRLLHDMTAQSVRRLTGGTSTSITATGLARFVVCCVTTATAGSECSRTTRGDWLGLLTTY